MPMYEYRCAECGEQYEELRRMTEADKDLRCPKCDSKNVQRQVSAFSSTASQGTGCGPSSSGRRFG
jgi:putative FmdB family regulatory protein